MNSWVVYLFSFVCFSQLVSSKSQTIKVTSYGVAIVWLSVNILNNFISIKSILSKDQNQFSEQYIELLSAPVEILSDGYIGMHSNDKTNTLRRMFFDNNIDIKYFKSKAKYLISEKETKDILLEGRGKVVWESSNFTITKILESDVVEVHTQWAVEGKSPVFRWISDGKYGYFYLTIDKSSAQQKYIHLCGNTIGKNKAKKLEINMTDVNNAHVGLIKMTPEYDCYSASIKGFYSPFKFSHKDMHNAKVSLVDGRRLVYQVMHIGVSESQFPSNYLYGNQKDIVDNISDIRLGENWHQFENYNNETFRWVKYNAEIFVRPIKNNTQLDMTVEKGESAGDIDLTISLIDEEKNIIDSCHVVKRIDCLFKLPLTSLTSKWTIISNAENNPVSYDHRLLNYRIFSMELK
jgi:hypothetical protein